MEGISFLCNVYENVTFLPKKGPKRVYGSMPKPRALEPFDNLSSIGRTELSVLCLGLSLTCRKVQ